MRDKRKDLKYRQKENESRKLHRQVKKEETKLEKISALSILSEQSNVIRVKAG